MIQTFAWARPARNWASSNWQSEPWQLKMGFFGPPRVEYILDQQEKFSNWTMIYSWIIHMYLFGLSRTVLKYEGIMLQDEAITI
jgi:hypothetical protein